MRLARKVRYFTRKKLLNCGSILNNSVDVGMIHSLQSEVCQFWFMLLIARIHGILSCDYGKWSGIRYQASTFPWWHGRCSLPIMDDLNFVLILHSNNEKVVVGFYSFLLHPFHCHFLVLFFVFVFQTSPLEFFFFARSQSHEWPIPHNASFFISVEPLVRWAPTAVSKSLEWSEFLNGSCVGGAEINERLLILALTGWIGQERVLDGGTNPRCIVQRITSENRAAPALGGCRNVVLGGSTMLNSRVGVGGRPVLG